MVVEVEKLTLTGSRKRRGDHPWRLNIGSSLIIFPGSTGWAANHFSRFTLKGPAYFVSMERASPTTLPSGPAVAIVQKRKNSKEQE